MRKIFSCLISFLGVLGLCIAMTNSTANALSDGDTEVGIRFTTGSSSSESSDNPPTTDTPTDNNNQGNNNQQSTGKLPQTSESQQWGMAFSGASILVVLGLIFLHRRSKEE